TPQAAATTAATKFTAPPALWCAACSPYATRVMLHLDNRIIFPIIYMTKHRDSASAAAVPASSEAGTGAPGITDEMVEAGLRAWREAAGDEFPENSSTTPSVVEAIFRAMVFGAVCPR